MANQQQTSQQQLITLLCLALYRMGGPVILDHLEELQNSILVPSVEESGPNRIILNVSKYVKEAKPDEQKPTE
jgi:hypothetical protein